MSNAGEQRLANEQYREFTEVVRFISDVITHSWRGAVVYDGADVEVAITVHEAEEEDEKILFKDDRTVFKSTEAGYVVTVSQEVESSDLDHGQAEQEPQEVRISEEYIVWERMQEPEDSPDRFLPLFYPFVETKNDQSGWEEVQNPISVAWHEYKRQYEQGNHQRAELAHQAYKLLEEQYDKLSAIVGDNPAARHLKVMNILHLIQEGGII